MANPPQPPRPAQNPAKKILGLFRKGADAPAWQPAAQLYPRLGASGIGKHAAVYALWHLGVRPQWLRVGATGNLADACMQMAKHPAIARHANAGLFIAWATPEPKQTAGIVRFLAARLAPALQNADAPWDISLDAAAAPMTYPLPPGSKES